MHDTIRNLIRKIYQYPYVFWSVIVLLALSVLQMAPENPMQRDDRGRTALYLAAENGDVERVGALLRRTGNPDQRDDCLWTPLMRAAQNGHIDTVRLLLDAGADVNATDKGGYTVLMVASSTDNPAVLKILVQHGASLDRQDPEYGWTALIWSAKEGFTGNIEVLVDAGADAGLEDNSGTSALGWALKNHHQEAADLLGTPG